MTGKRIGLYPGTFDPLTFGHADIIERGAKLVDSLVIGVAVNREKGPLFTIDERVEMVRDQMATIAGKTGVEITVRPFDNLLMHFAEEINADIIIRGLRAVTDFEYEFQMVGMNQALNDDIDTVFLIADARYQSIASRLVKEIARLGGDISTFVPAEIAQRVLDRFGKQQ